MWAVGARSRSATSHLLQPLFVLHIRARDLLARAAFSVDHHQCMVKTTAAGAGGFVGRGGAQEVSAHPCTRIGRIPGGGRPLFREGGPISYEPRPSRCSSPLRPSRCLSDFFQLDSRSLSISFSPLSVSLSLSLYISLSRSLSLGCAVRIRQLWGGKERWLTELVCSNKVRRGYATGVSRS